MRMRFTFEILAMALLMAAGSVLRPAASAAGCAAPSTVHAQHSGAASALHLDGGRG